MGEGEVENGAFVDVPLGGVWTAPDGTRYRVVGGGCARCAFLREPIRVCKTGVETTCANQVDADLNGGDRLACFPHERRDGVGVRFERVDESETTAATSVVERLVAAVRAEPGRVVWALVAVGWFALAIAWLASALN